MEYITAAEAANKWGVSLRQVQRLLSAGIIPDAQKYHRSWMIPADVPKPGVLRSEKPPQKSLSSDFNDVIAATYIPAPRDNPDSIINMVKEERMKIVPEIGLAYARGDFERVKQRFYDIKRDEAVKLCACPVTIAAAISLGDYPFFLELEGYLKNAVRANISTDVSAYAELTLAGAYLGAGAPNMIPEWLAAGDFSALPLPVKRNAAQMRVQYFRWQGNSEIMLAAAQTSLALCDSKQGISFEETYLRLLCGVACCALGRYDDATRYLRDAMTQNLPHGFITPFSELMPLFDGLLEQLLEQDFPAYMKVIKKQWERVFTNWLVFHNRFTKDNITLILTLREYEIARLAARGVPYSKIAEKFHLSAGTLKNKMHVICEKLFITGRDRKKELAKLIL